MDAEQSIWEDTVLDCYMAFFPSEGLGLFNPSSSTLEPFQDPDPSGDSVGSNINARASDLSGPFSGPLHLRQQSPYVPFLLPESPSSPELISSSLSPRAVEPCAGPGHDLGVPCPEPEEQPLPSHVQAPTQRQPPPPPPPTWSQYAGVGELQVDSRRLYFSAQSGANSAPPVHGYNRDWVESEQRIKKEEEDLFLADPNDLIMDGVPDCLTPLKQCNLSCSDLPSLAVRPGLDMHARALLEHPALGDEHPCNEDGPLLLTQGLGYLPFQQQQWQRPQQEQQQVPQRQLYQQQQQWQQQPPQLQPGVALPIEPYPLPHDGSQRSSSWQQPPAFMHNTSHSYPRSISCNDTLTSQPTQAYPAALLQARDISKGAKQRLGSEGDTQPILPLPELRQDQGQIEVLLQQQQRRLGQQQHLQYHQHQQGQQGQPACTVPAACKKKKNEVQPGLELPAASTKQKARPKLGKGVSVKPYRDKNRDNKFLIIKLERELEEKLCLATELEAQNSRLRQRERILGLSVSACEQNLHMRQYGGELSSYLQALLQSFKSDINMMAAKKVITSMANVACDKEMTIDLFRDSWQALTSEISDTLMKENASTANTGVTDRDSSRLSQVTSKVVDYIVAVCVRQRHLMQQAIGTNMITGQACNVDENLWSSIAKQLDIMPNQMRDLLATLGMFNACHDAKALEMEKLKSSLEQAMEQGLMCRDQVLQPNKQYVDMFQAVSSLEINLRRLSMLHTLVSFMTLKILTPLQICKLIILSMPAFPDIVGLLTGLGSQAQAESETPTSLTWEQCPLSEPVTVDKWGLGF